MTTHEAPADPRALRQEIVRTRADLGETVEALAAKTDVTARAKDAAGHAADAAKETAQHAAEAAKETAHKVRAQAGDVISNVGDHVRAGSDSVRESMSEIDMPPATRSLPVTALAAMGALVVGIVYLVRRRRS